MLGRSLIVALGCLAYLVSLPAWWVERNYSRGFYSDIQPVLTSASNLVPLALFDLLVAGAAVLLLIGGLRTLRTARRQRSWVPVGTGLLSFAAIVSLVYIVFLAIWGLNYERVPLYSRLEEASGSVGRDAVVAAGERAVLQLNKLYEAAHGEHIESWAQMRPYMTPAFEKTQDVLSPGTSPVAGVPKWSVFTYYFERAGISGMTDPFMLEILVDRGLLPVERPFVVAHEWAHLAGYADEGEANFIAWLTCMNGRPTAAYSGWLFLYGEVLGALPRTDRSRLAATLGPGPRADVSAIVERERRIAPLLQAASWQVYDRYLKANRVAAGVASYDKVLLMILGTKFSADGMPVMRKPIPD